MDGMHKSAKIFCMLHVFQLRKFLYSFFTVTAGTTSALNEFFSGNFSFQSHKFFTNTELCADLQLSAQSNRRVSVC